MLIKCKSCEKEISDQSKQCVHCNFPTDDLKNEDVNKIAKLFDLWAKIVLGVGIGSIIIIFFAVLASEEGVMYLPYVFVVGASTFVSWLLIKGFGEVIQILHDIRKKIK